MPNHHFIVMLIAFASFMQAWVPDSQANLVCQALSTQRSGS
jgi:hypothetical protein